MDKKREIRRVSDLFEKYKKTLIAPERTVLNAFIEIVEEVLGLSLDVKRLKYSPATKTLSLASTPALQKSEIQLHKVELLAHMKGRLGEKNAPETII